MCRNPTRGLHCPPHPHKPHHKHGQSLSFLEGPQRLSNQCVSETEGKMLTSAWACQAWVGSWEGCRQQGWGGTLLRKRRNECEHQGTAAYGEEGGTRRKEEGLPAKTGEGENGNALSRGIFGIFILDSARKDGLKGERDLHEIAFEGVRCREWRPRKMGVIQVAGSDFPAQWTQGKKLVGEDEKLRWWDRADVASKLGLSVSCVNSGSQGGLFLWGVGILRVLSSQY